MNRSLAGAAFAYLWLLTSCSPTGHPETPSPPSRFVAFRQQSVVIGRLEEPIRPPYAVGSSPSQDLLGSSDPAVVTVDPAGNLIAHRNGEATIHATGGGVLRVFVQAASALEIVPYRLELPVGGKQIVQVLGDGRPLPPEGYRWQTTDPNIAAAFGSTVQAGLMPGTATLTAMVGLARATAEVVVRTTPEGSLSLQPSRATVAVGVVQQLKVENMSARGVRWTTSNPAVLQPLQNGLFYAKAAGTARACAADASRKGCAAIKVVH